MLEQGFDYNDALKLIKRTNREKGRYIKKNYGVKDDNPDRYKFLFDMGEMREETVIQIICRAGSKFHETEIESV